ncbi:OmpP1/FadL family transporter [Porphyromonas sp. COT-239 OH1446]|uniref:OmpP1/FadL family transporter n=1 Tax=Porphyromonas sp. COT-239 OH1446 TaxID=1515613 RepID=UPI000AC37766|nr:hypothetical protein [Porphyromonas sp. COT-239 OH1446]
MRKKIVLGAGLLSLALLSVPDLWAQSESTAVSLADAHEQRGSARYQALGGAMGAVGAEFSAVNQNPASLALFRRGNKVSTTMGYTRQRGRSDWYNERLTTQGNLFNFDELSFMSSWNTGSKLGFTAGVGMRSGGRFHRSLQAHAALEGLGATSLADISAAVLNRMQYGRGGTQEPPLIPHSQMDGVAAYGRGHLPWLGILGYQAGWITSNDPLGGRYYSAFTYPTAGGGLETYSPYDAGLRIDERGAVSDFDFAFGMRVNDIFNFGATLTLVHLDYELSSTYSEGYDRFTDGRRHGLGLHNSVSISGGGARIGLGVLVEPLRGLRLGASVYSPTVYSLKHDFAPLANGLSSFGKFYQSERPENAANSFELRTPWRFGLSAAYVFAHKGFVSVDYEYSSLGGTRLDEARDAYGVRPSKTNPYEVDNDAISQDFGGKSTLRLGAEWMATRRLSLRAGYTRAEQKLKNPRLSGISGPTVEFLTPSTVLHFTLPGTRESFSLGLGYKLSPSWSLDVAYVHQMSRDKVYAFSPMADLGPILDPAKRNAIARGLRDGFDVIDADLARETGATWLKGLKGIDYRQDRSQMLFSVSYRF